MYIYYFFLYCLAAWGTTGSFSFRATFIVGPQSLCLGGTWPGLGQAGP